MVKTINMRKVLLWLCLLTLFAGLVWAVDAFMAQADKQADTAASLGAKDELATIQTTMVRPKKQTNIDWKTIGQYNKQLTSITNEYEGLLQKASAEKQAGTVSEATRSAGMASAKKFNDVCEKLAAVYQKGNCVTRAKTTRAAGKSRLKNADMAFASINSDNISAYNEQRSAMFDAGEENLKEVKADGNPDDVAKLKANMLPRLQQMASQTTSLIAEIGKLLDQVRRAAGGDVGAIAGCAKQVVSSGAADGPAGLIKPLMSLLNMAKNLGSNLATMASSVASL